MSKHTPGPLAFGQWPSLEKGNANESGWVEIWSEADPDECCPYPIISCKGHDPVANARRLVACWNACDGISTEELEAGLIAGLISIVRAKNAVDRQRDELLFALIDLLPDAISNHIGGADTQARIDAARAAIGKAEGNHD